MDKIIEELQKEETILFLGQGVFKGVVNSNGHNIPYDNESMILGINNGRAMAPKYMDDYSKAAMNIEQRRGRAILEEIMHALFSSDFPMPEIYKGVEKIQPSYIIDLNYDDSLQKLYSKEHYLITGVARILADLDRYASYIGKEGSYTPIKNKELAKGKTIVYKPLGSTVPDKNFIVSDADFVDWITEAMGGFSFPKLIKELRVGKKYLFLGVDFGIDTSRMVANEITQNLAGGYYVSDKKKFTKREEKFITNHSLEVIPEETTAFVQKLVEAI